MLSGKDNVLATFDLNNLPHWKIYYDSTTGAANPIATSIREGNFSQDESRARLSQYLDMLGAGNYRIDFKNTFDQPKSFYSTKFQISNTNQQGFNSPAIGNLHQGGYQPSSEYVHKDDVQKMVAEIMEREHLKKRVAELEEIVAETSENSMSGAIGKMMNQYPQILPMLAAKFLGSPQVGVAGFEEAPPQQFVQQAPPQTEAEAEQETTELDQRMHRCIVKLIQLENGSNESAVNLLEKLLAWIEQNPVMYASLKPTILQTEVKN